MRDGFRAPGNLFCKAFVEGVVGASIPRQPARPVAAQNIIRLRMDSLEYSFRVGEARKSAEELEKYVFGGL